MAESAELPAIEARLSSDGPEALDEGETQRYLWTVGGIMRYWENEFYQYQSGLFSEAIFQARTERWRADLTDESPRGDFFRVVWEGQRDRFDPDFRAEIDRLVAEVEQAQ